MRYNIEYMEPNVQKPAHPVFGVTTFSKYFSLALFVLMPFIGGYIGYVYAPEKVVEVECLVIKNVEEQKESNPLVDVGSASTTYDDLIEALSLHPNLSIFTELLVNSGLASTSLDGKKITLFIPTNEAFEKSSNDLPRGVTYPLSTNNTEIITHIVKGHIIEGDYNRQKLTHGLILTSLNGSKITVFKSSNEQINLGWGIVEDDSYTFDGGTFYLTDTPLMSNLPSH